MSQCSERTTGIGESFDLVQTQTGVVHAAWLDYVWDVDYSLHIESYAYDPDQSGCHRTETSGTGTTDLVIARLTDRDPVLTRFRLYAGYVPEFVHEDPVVMTTRGDTLVVLAAFNVGIAFTLKYLEIDSTQLP